MELKTYQQNVLADLSAYLDALNSAADLDSAWRGYWAAQDIVIGLDGVPAYNNSIPAVPHVCMKVPTGGGKTFLACAALKKIFDFMPLSQPRIAVWLVPSDSILTQTISNLTSSRHPYRQRLDTDFAGRVSVFTKDMLLNGQGFSPDTVRETLSVCIFSYNSLRIDRTKKDARKVYQENGNLLRFANYFEDSSALLADTPDTALIQILRNLAPVIIVDESHNAESDLSIEMLRNLNPSFVLDLTATPRKNSNIISYVDARELKKESMVKLPVVVCNQNSTADVIQNAIQLQSRLEQQAMKSEKELGEPHVRPIVLFQAQPKTSKDSETFEKIKASLMAMEIPEEQIAIKTSSINELGTVDLLSRNCPIRYIITVNALKEGWDCPFAYILASLANKTSKVEVEQIVGRILRQPYARKHASPLLNMSYVFTSSNDFHATLENVVKGLNQAGFTRKDYRVAEVAEFPVSETEPKQHELPFTEMDAENIKLEPVSPVFSEQELISNPTIISIEQTAQKIAQEYETALTSGIHDGFRGGELGDMLRQYAVQAEFRQEIQALRIPQFFLKTVPNLFGGDSVLLEQEHLSEGFRLSGQDAQISFEFAAGEMYRIDIDDQGEAIPKYRRINSTDSEYIRNFLATQPQEAKIRHCIDMIAHQINKNNRYSTADINAYVLRVVDGLDESELVAMETAVPFFAQKIQQKIESLENRYREELFYRWLDGGKITCQPCFALPEVITPSEATDSIPNSLYESERDDLNSFEYKLLDVIASLDNVRWWHRIHDRKGFRLNAFINHFPDFLVMTKSKKLLLIEAKGDYLDGDDSRTKLKLGRAWQNQAGADYRYFMVFQDKDLGFDGAYTFDKFTEVLKTL